MTKYAVISDAHLGLSDKVGMLYACVKRLRGYGYKIIWLGDTYDTVLKHEVEHDYPSLIVEDDVRIIGNHDWKENGLESFSHSGVFFTHGDLIDFGFGALRLSKANKQKTLIERVFSKFRDWSVNDVYLLYREIEALEDSEVASFGQGLKSYKYLPKYIKLVFNLLKYPSSLIRPHEGSIPALVRNNYITGDPTVLLPRIQSLYPASKGHHTVVVGHMHRSINRTVHTPEGLFTFICVNAWTPSREPDILMLEESGAIEIVKAKDFLLL